MSGVAIQASDPHVLIGTNNPNLLNSSHYSANFSYHRFAVSPDGQQFLFPQPAVAVPANRGTRGGAAAPIAEGLATAVDAGRIGATANEIAIVLDWTRLMTPK